MTHICPHCNYARKPDDRTPDWQCPACEKAYAKASPNPTILNASPYGQVAQPERGNGAFKWVLIFAALIAFAWFGRPVWQSHVPRTVEQSSAAQPEVVLYATDWCGYCKMTREFFAANGIRYTEFDIEKSSEASTRHRKLGGNGVPLIVVGGEVINGYNEGTLRQLLAPWIKG